MARVISLRSLCILFNLALALPYNDYSQEMNQRSDQPIVTIRNGSYYGIHSSNYKQDFFLGIPFAQPPVGDLRLQPPASLNTSWAGLRNATEYSPACYGYGEDTFIGALNYCSEDCLTLNVVRPSGYEQEKLPVGVWIYGGGYFEGSSRDPRYNLSFIVEQSVEMGKPIMAVSFNYRLHFLGWPYSQDALNAGVTNLGLRDQRLALHWLQENINEFGGDATKVTIWGESAGALSVGLHILAYNGRDDKLFSGAIAESGATSGVGLINPTISVAEAAYENITEAVGCSNAPDKLACLRLVPIEELNNTMNSITGEDYYQVYFGPLVDGDIIARGSIEQLKDGAFVKVPYIMGVNSDDGTDFTPQGIDTDEDFIAFYQGYGIDNATLEDLLRLYPNDPMDDIPLSAPGVFNDTIGLQFKRSATLIGDIGFTAPRRFSAQMWNQHTDVALYSYRFNAIPNGIADYYGVTHFQEVAFVFHNVHGYGFPNIDPPYFGPDPFANRPKSFFELATLMSRMWASFIHDGNPNFLGQNAIQWPPYTAQSPMNFVFNANTTSNLEVDNVREEAVRYLIEKYLSGTYPWAAHDQS